MREHRGGTWSGSRIHTCWRGRHHGLLDGAFEDSPSESGSPPRCRRRKTIEGQSHQNLTEADGVISTRGQGFFLRGDGEGLVLHDVGRLDFDPGDGSTQFATPKVLPFNDTDLESRIDAAVCGMFD